MKTWWLQNSFNFSRRITCIPLTATVKDKRNAQINCLTCFDKISNWPIRSGHSHGFCKHCNTIWQKWPDLKHFIVFKKTEYLPWLLISENQSSSVWSNSGYFGEWQPIVFSFAGIFSLPLNASDEPSIHSLIPLSISSDLGELNAAKLDVWSRSSL